MRPRRIFLLATAALTISCDSTRPAAANSGGSGLSRQEVLELIESKLAASQAAPNEDAADTSDVHDTVSPGDGEPDHVAGSLAFLTALDKLMEGYEPSMPADESDPMSCVTSYAFANDDALKPIAKRLDKKRDAARKEREKVMKEFYENVLPVNFTIDLDWENRMALVPGRKCWDKCQNAWDYDENCRREADGYCTRGPGSCRCWKKTSGALSDSIFRYSNTPTRSQPELMKRMEAAGVVAPPRFHCKVDDVLPQESPMIICAAARDDKPVVRVVGDLAAVNVGDVISVPLAESKVADPVLSKGTQGNKGDTYLAWTVAADGASIKVESQAACPTVEELVASVSK